MSDYRTVGLLDCRTNWTVELSGCQTTGLSDYWTVGLLDCRTIGLLDYMSDAINDLQNTTQKNKDRATRTPLTTGGELRCSGRVGCSCSTSDTRRVTLVTNLVISHG